jgi:hypothetical protein
MKIARVTGPLNCDAFALVLSKMKENGFTGVLVSVTPENWRLQHPIIVSHHNVFALFTDIARLVYYFNRFSF